MAVHSNSADSARRPDPKSPSSRSVLVRCLLGASQAAASHANASAAVGRVTVA